MKSSITLDIFDEKGASLGKKRFYTTLDSKESINKWIKQYDDKNNFIALVVSTAPDFQHNQQLAILSKQQYTTLDSKESINKWIKQYDDKNNFIALVVSTAPDFQHNQQLAILSKQQERYCFYVSLATLIPFSVYFSVRHCIKATWINDRDQFLAPNKKWEKDAEFQNDCLIFMLFHGQNRITCKEGIKNDCLIFMLFHGQNRITCKEGINHFIPFSEKELNAQEAFESHFMQDFLQGKIKQEQSLRGSGNATTKQSKNTSIDCHADKSAHNDKVKSKPLQTSLFKDELESSFIPTKPLEFSDEAKEVLQAGKELFKHYHEQTRDSKDYNANAALYDIKAHFQGFNDKGKMNPPQKAQDEAYKERLGILNYALKELAKKIEVKVYEYGFLLP